MGRNEKTMECNDDEKTRSPFPLSPEGKPGCDKAKCNLSRGLKHAGH